MTVLPVPARTAWSVYWMDYLVLLASSDVYQAGVTAPFRAIISKGSPLVRRHLDTTF